MREGTLVVALVGYALTCPFRQKCQGEWPHASPGQPQGSPHPLVTTPALTMTPSRLRGRAVVIVGVRTRLPRPKKCQGERG